MDGAVDGGSEARFVMYVEQLARVLGHADRREPLHDYCLGLLMPIERKSVEPMAAVTAPAQVAAKHQSLLPNRSGHAGHLRARKSRPKTFPSRVIRGAA
jgi:SRSO17 transposase